MATRAWSFKTRLATFLFLSITFAFFSCVYTHPHYTPFLNVMNSFQNQYSQLYQSPQSTRNASRASLSDSGAPIHCVDPMKTLLPSVRSIQPHSHSSHPFPPSALTPSSTTVTPSPGVSVRASSTRQTSLQPLPTRPPTTHIPSIPHNIRATKRAREHTPNQPTPLARDPPTDPSLERPVKRQKVGVDRPSKKANRRSMPPPPLPKKPATVNATPPNRKPKQKKGPLHPLAVDWSRPVKFVDPRPPSHHVNPRRDRVPVCPHPEYPELRHSLDEELRGPVDPKVAKEFAGLMWAQQRRIWCNRESYADPYLSVPISILDDGSSIPPQQSPALIALYGPASRSVESTHLGDSLTNPNVIVLNDEEDDNFGEVLDLYRAAVQGSALSRELELEVWGDDGLAVTGWEDVGSLEISVKRSAPSPSGEPQETNIRSLEGYKQVIKEETASSLTRVVEPEEEPPLGICWTYSACGYATGTVKNAQKAARSQKCRTRGA